MRGAQKIAFINNAPDISTKVKGLNLLYMKFIASWVILVVVYFVIEFNTLRREQEIITLT